MFSLMRMPANSVNFLKILMLMMNLNNMKPCPCTSGLSYDQCCGPYHNGDKKPPTALALMRSRYSAYALGLPDYIITTTDPLSHPTFGDRDSWKKKILKFSSQTLFENLTIISHSEENYEATVTFIAHLRQGNKDASFKEESVFRKFNNSWVYTKGKVENL